MRKHIYALSKGDLMKFKKLCCLPLAIALLLSGCGARTGENEDVDSEEAGYRAQTPEWDSFSQPYLTLEDPVFDRAGALRGASFGGAMGERIENLVNRWLYTAYYSNSGMMERFYQRDAAIQHNLVAWYGEFPGKYLMGIARVYALYPDEELKKIGDSLTDALFKAQGEDGYLGVFSREDRMLGSVSMDIGGSTMNTSNWDMWNHYHIIRGLLEWYDRTGNELAFETAKGAARYIADYFNDGHSLSEIREGDKNLSILPVYLRLYEMTGEQAWLDFANGLLAAWQGENGGDFYRRGLAGTPYNGLKQKRWETMHAVLGLADVYELTGDESYKQAFLNLYRSLCEYERHNSGGMMSGEQAVGSPYREGSVETCATVTWMELTAKALRLTGDSRLADELELSTLNALLGAQAASGRNFTYSTPDEGVRLASAIELGFQATAGSPELNCCSMSGPNGFGLLSEWAAGTDERGVTVNYYGESSFALTTPSGAKLLVEEETDYPRGGAVAVKLSMEAEEEFTLRLRIPAWAEGSAVTVNGESVECKAGEYCSVRRVWKSGDVVRLDIAMTVHAWQGEENRAGQVSLYYGPLLLTYDERFNGNLPKEELPQLELGPLRLSPAQPEVVPAYPEPVICLEAECAGGTRLVLCDFATAGQAGTDYTSWLPAVDPELPEVRTGAEKWLSRWEGEVWR